jgi:hypothetical protein
LTGIISIGDLVKNIISNHQFTIDQLSHYLHGWGRKNTEVRNGQLRHRHFAVRWFELDDQTIGIETG